MSICHLNLYLRNSLGRFLRFVCLSALLYPSLSLLSRFLCLPSATAILLCLFFAPTWLRCFGNADNISCASAAVGSALATAAPALPLPLLCAAAALSPSLVLAGNSTDSFVSLFHPSPPVLRFCGCHNRRQFYLCCFMSTLTRALMRSYTHSHTRAHREIQPSHTRSLHARSVDIFINVAQWAAKPNRVEPKLICWRIAKYGPKTVAEY